MPLTNMRNNCMERRLIKIFVVIINDVKNDWICVVFIHNGLTDHNYDVWKSSTEAPTLKFYKKVITPNVVAENRYLNSDNLVLKKNVHWKLL